MASRRTKRADGRYLVTLTVENPDGSTRRVYFYGRTQAEARAKAREAQERIALGAPVRDASRSFGDWLSEWRATFLAASDRAPSTKALYGGLLERYARPQLDQVPLARITPADLTRVLLAMERAGRAASTRRNMYAALRATFDDAVTNGLLGASPAVRVKRPRAVAVEAPSMTPGQAAQLLAAIAGKRYASVVRLLLGTGLRRGEVLALRWSDLDLERGELTVRGSLVRQGGGLVVSAPKTAHSRRTVSLSEPMMGLLRVSRHGQLEERLRAANYWQDSGHVFTTELGRPVDPRNLLRLVRDGATAIGLSGIGVHTLRHTYATTALLHGVPLHVVSRNLGHSSVAITADTYGHLTDDASRSAAATVAAALNL
ncbi:tyrosine-type recombinase/integrase [Nocardioides sp. AX2bis]|uniref:tyrosine-type recombinase/integrase n=1 Tax=Nocardioides sp. AX2bis TaxID=2653157 RepID=UPI0012EFD2B7|nr:site-specific integrase [Nocardioides sp. AX2bis]VXB09803.1 Site-specific integrase [Nocardioides sp. AX2bis]